MISSFEPSTRNGATFSGGGFPCVTKVLIHSSHSSVVALRLPLLQLLGSGLLFSTGLVWFFVQAWMFAIEAETAWLIILLTITSTVALLSQSYLCAVVLSINPVSTRNRIQITMVLVAIRLSGQ